MNMNQVAITYTTDEQREAIKRGLGLADAEWIVDTVRAEVKVRMTREGATLSGHDAPDLEGKMLNGRNVAELQFCLTMGGAQFELIRYLEGPNWIAEGGLQPGQIAHVGFHLDEGEHWPTLDGSALLVQEAWTVGHTNEEINKVGRRYHYRIFRTAPLTYLKFIKRLTVDVGAAS